MKVRYSAKGLLAFMLCLCLSMTACNTSWISIALQDLPVLVQIATSIAGIVGAAQGRGQIDPALASQIQNVSGQVKADLVLLQSLVDSYKAADAATKPGILNKINAALASTQNNLNALLTAAHVSNPGLQATISTSVGLAITTVLAIQSLLPGPIAKAAQVQKKPMSSGQLKSAFNSVVSANGYGEFAIQ